MGCIVPLLLGNTDSFGIKLPMKVDMRLNKEIKSSQKEPSRLEL